MRTFYATMIIILTTSLTIFAQDNTEEPKQETLLSSHIENGGFGGPVFKVSPINGSEQIWAGGYGGWLINHVFMLGGGGYGMVSHVSAPEATPKINGRVPEMKAGYGGLMLEYAINPEKLIHFNVQVLVGAGGVGYSYSVSDTTQNLVDMTNTSTSDSFFVTELGAHVELNVTTFLRLGLGGSYRIVSGVSLPGLENKDLSGPSANFVVKFGKF